MPASLEFILGILDERSPAFASHDDFTGPHGRALQLWQRLGFLAREPESHPAAGLSPLPRRLALPARHETPVSGLPEHGQSPSFGARRFDLDAFLSWLAQGLNLTGGGRPLDDNIWHLGSLLLDDRRQECFFHRGATLSAQGRERLLAASECPAHLVLAHGPAGGFFQATACPCLIFSATTRARCVLPTWLGCCTAGRAVRFDAGSGTLWAGDRVLGHVPPGGKECHFLDCLWRHAGAVVPYADIRHHVMQQSGSRDAVADEATYCQKLKSAVKKRITNIDDVIAATNKGHGYQLLTHAGQREEP